MVLQYRPELPAEPVPPQPTSDWLDLCVNPDTFVAYLDAGCNDPPLDKLLAQLVDKARSEHTAAIVTKDDVSVDTVGKRDRLWRLSLACVSHSHWDMVALRRALSSTQILPLLDTLLKYATGAAHDNEDGLSSLTQSNVSTLPNASRFALWMYARWCLAVDLSCRLPPPPARLVVSNPARETDANLMAESAEREATESVRGRVALAASVLGSIAATLDTCELRAPTAHCFSPAGEGAVDMDRDTVSLQVHACLAQAHYDLLQYHFANNDMATAAQFCGALKHVTAESVSERHYNIDFAKLRGLAMMLRLEATPVSKQPILKDSRDLANMTTAEWLSTHRTQPEYVVCQLVSRLPADATATRCRVLAAKIAAQRRLSEHEWTLLLSTRETFVAVLTDCAAVCGDSGAPALRRLVGRLPADMRDAVRTQPEFAQLRLLMRRNDDECNMEVQPSQQAAAEAVSSASIVLPAEEADCAPPSTGASELWPSPRTVCHAADWLHCYEDTCDLTAAHMFAATDPREHCAKAVLPPNSLPSPAVVPLLGALSLPHGQTVPARYQEFSALVGHFLNVLAKRPQVCAWESLANDWLTMLPSNVKAHPEVLRAYACERLRLRIVDWSRRRERYMHEGADGGQAATADADNVCRIIYDHVAASKLLPTGSIGAVGSDLELQICVFLLNARRHSDLVGTDLENIASGMLDVAKLLAVFFVDALPTLDSVAAAVTELLLPTFTDVYIRRQMKRDRDGGAGKAIYEPSTMNLCITRDDFFAAIPLLLDGPTLEVLLGWLCAVYSAARGGGTTVYNEYAHLWPKMQESMCDSSQSAGRGKSVVNERCAGDAAAAVARRLAQLPAQKPHRTAAYYRVAADLAHARKEHSMAASDYLSCVAVATDAFTCWSHKHDFIDETLVTHLMDSLIALHCPISAALCAQLCDTDGRLYAKAARVAAECAPRLCNEPNVIDTLRMVWTVELAEYLIDTYDKLQLPHHVHALTSAMFRAEMNAHNFAEVHRAAVHSRRRDFLTALCHAHCPHAALRS